MASNGKVPRPRLRLVNAFTRWILHTPGLRGLADRQVCELRFAGARTGRTIVLPVMYAERNNRIVVLVGGARSKQWWRSFTRPHVVLVWLRGQAREGVGHIVRSGSAERGTAEQIYRQRFPSISIGADPMVVIALEPNRS